MKETKNYALKVTYTADIENHSNNPYGDDEFKPVYNKEFEDTINLYHFSGNKYFIHKMDNIIPGVGHIDISSDLMNEQIIDYFVKYYTRPGCAWCLEDMCEARGEFNIVIKSIEFIEN